MNILISQRHSQNRHGDWIDSLESSYISYFEQSDIFLIPVANASLRVANLFQQFKIDGIILTGGGDVDPELYGGEYFPELAVSKQRDTAEKILLEKAIENNIPVLGVCRGMQYINVFFGGSLVQNIHAIDPEKKHDTPGFHKIKLVNSEIIEYSNNKRSFSVNSYHNLGILPENIAVDLEPFAVFEDLRLVEGLYHRSLPIAGIQWHPERSNGNTILDQILIKSFFNKTLFWASRNKPNSNIL